jgi:hypothetical protein
MATTTKAAPMNTSPTASPSSGEQDEVYLTNEGYELIAASELNRLAHQMRRAVKRTQRLITRYRLAHSLLSQELRRELQEVNASEIDMRSLGDFVNLEHNAAGFAWACQMFAAFVDGILIPLPKGEDEATSAPDKPTVVQA